MKMAPVCMARRPRLSDPLLLCVFLLFLSLLMNHADSLLTYDRETLLNIRLATENLGKTNVDGQDFFPPPLLSGVPHHLDYTPTPSHKRKRFKRRGKRSGLLVKLKSYLAPSSGSNRLVSQCILTEFRPLHRRFVSCRFLEPIGTWLVPVVGLAEEIQRPRLLLPRLRRGGANPRNLRHLKQVPWMAATGPTDPTRFMDKAEPNYPFTAGSQTGLIQDQRDHISDITKVSRCITATNWYGVWSGTTPDGLTTCTCAYKREQPSPAYQGRFPDSGLTCHINISSNFSTQVFFSKSH